MEGALAVFRRAKSAVRLSTPLSSSLTLNTRSSQSVPLPVHSFSVLLHLCSGGNTQAEAAEKRYFPAEANEVQSCIVLSCESDKEHAFTHYPSPLQVYEHMSATGIPPVEMTFTALVRVAAATGDPQKAYDMARFSCFLSRLGCCEARSSQAHPHRRRRCERKDSSPG